MTLLPRLHILLIIARYELKVALRSRWVLSYAFIFAVLTLAISYFGLAVIEFTGFQDFDRTTLSLLNLVLYIVPLATMLMAVQSFRAEGGATEQLFAEPVSAAEITVGKLLGLGMTHVVAVLLGFSVAASLIGSRIGFRGLGSYLVLLAFTLLIGLVFLSLSCLLTVCSHRTSRAYAVVLVAWFVLVLLFDLLVIGISFLLPEVWANRAAFAGVLLNPIDATRVATLLAISGRELFGPAGAQLVRFFGGVPQAIALLVLVLTAWVLLPAALASHRLQNQDL